MHASLSEFETFVMGLFIPLHTPSNLPPPRFASIGIIYLFKVRFIYYTCVIVKHAPISKGVRLFCVCTKLGLILKQTGEYIFCGYIFLFTSVCLNVRCTIYKTGIIDPN